MKQSIYIVEDDVALQELYGYSLKDEFDYRCFDDGSSFFEALAGGNPDLIILDIMLPGDDGYAILTRLKDNMKTSEIPVIIVSAKGDEISKVKGLNLGADDYMGKPFGILEFIARIKANLRKSGKVSTESIEGIVYKDLTIDHKKHLITVNEKQIKTALKEYRLLCLLCENAETVLDRETIFSKVWGEGYIGETRTLDIHIKELRKKLLETKSEVIIQTVRGIGYMLT